MSFHCKACETPLVLELEPDSNEESYLESKTVPDDLELRCGCHFHWQCLFDQSAEVAISLKCPSCESYLPVNQEGPSVTNPYLAVAPGSTMPTRYVNEGGIQDNLDILPTITEEAYLTAHPEARPARAFHLMCAEGDLNGSVELLRDLNEAYGGDVVQLGHLLRYRDPLAGGVSSLHLAVQKDQEEMAWLLLWLASSIPSDTFPDHARQVAESWQIQRIDVAGDDIRGLQTDDGLSAADMAHSQGGRWATLASILQAPGK